MKRVVLATLAGAVVAQIWGMVSWMGIGWHFADFRQFSGSTVEIADVMRPQLQGSGLYTIPNMDHSVHEDAEKKAAWDAQAKQGPFVFMAVRADGIELGMGRMMGIGFLINLFMAGVLVWLLGKTSISGILGQAAFVGIAGGIGAVYPHLANWNWWHFPIMYCAVGVIDLFITWFLAGLAIAKLAPPARS